MTKLKGINHRNLLRMAEYIEKTPQERFDMRNYRNNGNPTFDCGAVGCIIGHCVVLSDHKDVPKDSSSNINFAGWLKQFTSIDPDNPDHYPHYCYLFADLWFYIDNTPQGASDRIIQYIQDGLPNNWENQMKGIESLSYHETNPAIMLGKTVKSMKITEHLIVMKLDDGTIVSINNTQPNRSKDKQVLTIE